MMSGLRVIALSALLAAAPVLPSLPEAPAPVQTAAASDVETLFAQAMQRPVSRGAALALDTAQLTALMGNSVALTFKDGGYDAATGAHRLTDVTFALPGEEDAPLFTAAEALVWNLDAGALAARMRGERLGETLRIFDRIELNDIVFDLTEYADTVTDAVAAIDGEAATRRTETSSMDVGTFALGGLTLHPWTHEAVEGEEEGIAAIRMLSAFARSFSLETMLFLDATTRQTMSDEDISGSIVASYPRQLVYGYDRGRIGGLVQTDVTFDGLFKALGMETGEPATQDFSMSGKSGAGSWTGLDFSKLLEWGEKGEMPPFSERELWSLGSYLIEDTSVALGGKPVFEIGKMEFSAAKFSWFLPEELRISHEDVALDLGAFFDFANTIAPDTAEASETEPSLTEIAAMLDRAGLSRISGDGALTFRWNPETGATMLENSGTTDGLFSGVTRVEGTLPSYAALAPMFGEDGQSYDEKAMEGLLEDHAVLTTASMRLTDLGGLNTLAALTIEIAKSGAVEDPMMANFASSTPEALRMFASGLVVLGSASMTKEFPQAPMWAGSLSQFITKGGTFEVSVAPKPELFNDPGAESGGMSEQTPGALAELLGVMVTHTPSGDAPQTEAGSP
jgi:hypothetical protein